MRENIEGKQKLGREWGYIDDERDGFRPLTQEEHERLTEARHEEGETLREMIAHTKETVRLFQERDPQIKAQEIVMVVINNLGYDAVEDFLGGFDQLRKTLKIGNPLNNGWLVTVEDGIRLNSKLPEYCHFPAEADIKKQLLRTVEVESFLSKASLDAWFNED